MQKLIFESAWDKTIAPADRKKITAHFHASQIKEGIRFSFLWTATNYKKEQLVTVLIHNATTESLQIQDMTISFQLNQSPEKTGFFTLPLQIPAQTSMPWTFIFSNKNQTEQVPTYTIYS